MTLFSSLFERRSFDTRPLKNHLSSYRRLPCCVQTSSIDRESGKKIYRYCIFRMKQTTPVTITAPTI